MPKKVDHQKQREKVAAAVWRVATREGIEKASVRNIAKEAGLPVSTMRHYFTNQSELLLFAMKSILSGIEQRVYEKIRRDYTENPDMTAFEAAKRMSMFFIHIDHELEIKIWLSFTAKSLYDAEMKQLSNEMYMDLYGAMKQVIEVLQQAKLTKVDLDVELEIDRLYALVDGIAIHRLIKPDWMTRAKAERLITHHLESLLRT
ncbi:transcriptional regulator, TetR family [Seinonella peptonophila]|uniref:Transcriptional regulator, TetR family n=1 Tax=Seinonella peptonophila TaxID=112248 RepID=A0A1M4ZWL3_9BACL|nr:TetR family transcriptional regulator C-terminal domain-containing protein [Seinonella peptonophila]SHF22423.1 transcriptional regulator, TetR family [Seinonella peptonophila]